MQIPTKFKVNTENFKIYFDNTKKTHVCENVETGEKTNIGVLGILMQMGILKPIEENRGMEERIKFLSDKINSLENKLDEFINNSTVKERKEVEEDVEEPEETEEVEEKPKSEIKKRIMKKFFEQTEKKEEPEEVEEKEEESDAAVESDEEIDNWMKI